MKETSSRAFRKSPFHKLYLKLDKTANELINKGQNRVQNIRFLSGNVTFRLYSYYGYDYNKFLNSSYEEISDIEGIGTFSANKLYALTHSYNLEDFLSWSEEAGLFTPKQKPKIKEGNINDLFKIKEEFKHTYSYEFTQEDKLRDIFVGAIAKSGLNEGIIDILRVGSQYDCVDDLLMKNNPIRIPDSLAKAIEINRNRPNRKIFYEDSIIFFFDAVLNYKCKSHRKESFHTDFAFRLTEERFRDFSGISDISSHSDEYGLWFRLIPYGIDYTRRNTERMLKSAKPVDIFNTSNSRELETRLHHFFYKKVRGF